MITISIISIILTLLCIVLVIYSYINSFQVNMFEAFIPDEAIIEIETDGGRRIIIHRENKYANTTAKRLNGDRKS